MKIKKTTINDDETSISIDLFEGKTLTKRVKKRIQEEVGNFLVEQTLISMNEKKSPVSGEGNFPALSKDYKKKKLEIVGSGEANLEFDGVMKDELAYKESEIGVDIGVYGERAPAADGHNNLSGKSNLKKRQFLPNKGQNYKGPIKKEVERIVADIIAEETTFRKSDFVGIETKSELYAKLKTIFGDLPRTELNLAVFRNEELTNLFKQLDLIGLL